MKTKPHKHYWFYEQATYAGRTNNEVGVVRYCECGVTQIAFTDKWQKPPKGYDLSDVGRREESQP